MIPLKEWADKHGIPHRTALYRAKNKVYPAKMQKRIVRTVHETPMWVYMIDPDFLPPESK